MTLKELKIEADKLGYALVKRQPYIPSPTCKCTNYRKGIERYYEPYKGWFYRCPICGCESEPARLVRDAELNWYNFTREKFGRPEVKRR